MYHLVSEKFDHQEARLQSLTVAVKGYPLKQCDFYFLIFPSSYI